MRQHNSLFFRIFSSKVFLFIFLVIVVYLSVSVYQEVKQRMAVKKEISNLRAEIKNLNAENNNLDQLIKYFGTEEYIESSSREKLGYKKPGEKIVVFNTESHQDDSHTKNQTPDLDNISNIKLWWNYFFNNVHHSNF